MYLKIRAGGGGTPLIRVPSAEDLFGGVALLRRTFFEISTFRRAYRDCAANCATPPYRSSAQGARIRGAPPPPARTFNKIWRKKTETGALE